MPHAGQRSNLKKELSTSMQLAAITEEMQFVAQHLVQT